MSSQPVRVGTFQELPNYIGPNDLVLDVGGGDCPLSRADYVIDIRSWDELAIEPTFKDVWPAPHFSRERWVTWDICARDLWPFRDKQFDFILCKHTLEDVRDPVWVCEEMMRVGKGGYIETPSRIIESMPCVERRRYCGYSHHRWLCEVTEEGIEFVFKHAQIHGYSRFHINLTSGQNKSRRHHGWRETFDPMWSLLMMANRWFRQINPKYATVGFYWLDGFQCREKVVIEKREVEADLMAFKDQCRLIKDLWVWRRR